VDVQKNIYLLGLPGNTTEKSIAFTFKYLEKKMYVFDTSIISPIDRQHTTFTKKRNR
jgi:hypothetical protein